jgi:rfaE bifunctional protein kinase chain/domain
LVKEIERRGISTVGLVLDRGRPTTVKTRVIAHNQQVVRTDREAKDEIDGKVGDHLLRQVTANLEDCDAAIISDYGKGVITKHLLDSLIPQARSKQKILSVDPKDTHFMNYRQVSLITPNQYEAGGAVGKRIEDEDTLLDVGWRIMDLLQTDALLITRGEHGMSLFEKDRTYHHFPTVARQVYDVTGAGDTVICSFTLALCGGATMAEAAQIANHAAGRVIREIGTATITPRDLVTSFQDLEET